MQGFEIMMLRTCL